MVDWISRQRPRFAAAAIVGACATALAVPFIGTSTATASRCPTRIVSLSPTATEDLFAVGAGRQVVAVDSDSNYPGNAPRKSGLDAYEPNAEAIAGDYDPDLVVVSYDANHVIEELRAIPGIRVLYEPTAANLAAAYDQIEAIGEATCHTAAAVHEVGTIKRQLTAIERATGTKGHGLTYYDEISAPPSDYAASSRSFIGELFTLLGMRNITNAASGYPELSQESIVHANPEMIFLSDNEPADGGVTIADVEHRHGWSTIRAIRDHAIYDLNDDAASRWGPRIVVLMREISNAIAAFRRAH